MEDLLGHLHCLDVFSWLLIKAVAFLTSCAQEVLRHTGGYTRNRLCGDGKYDRRDSYHHINKHKNLPESQ